MATPCTNSLGGESGGHRHEGCEGRSVCWKFAAVSWSGAGGMFFSDDNLCDDKFPGKLLV